MGATFIKRADPGQPRHFDSEEEFAAWCDEDSDAEYVDGEVIMPTPASIAHDDMLTWLSNLMRLFVDKHELGKVLGAGHVQVRLRPGLRRNPDIVFVARHRQHLLREAYIEGAPDLIVEWVSPESTVRDWHDKLQDYEAAGVREYWIIDAQLKRVELNAIGDDGRYHLVEAHDDKLRSNALTGFWIKPEWLWRESLPRVNEAAGELGLI